MSDVVWVANWEVQCCGEPFELGSSVCWDVATTRTAAWLDDHLRPLSQPRPTYQYSVHGVEGPNEDLFRLTGTVRTIAALHYDLHPEPYRDSGRMALFPTPGTERLTPVTTDLMWQLEPAHPERETFAGWLVEIEVTKLEPRQPVDPSTQVQVAEHVGRLRKWWRKCRRSSSTKD